MKMLFMIIHLTNFPKQARFCSIKCHINNYRAIRGSSREKLYQELGLELLKSRRWYQQLSLFFKLKKNKHSSYFFDKIPKVLWTWTTRNHNNIPLFKDTLMQIWKPIYISLSSHENNMPNILHYNNIYFLSYTHPRYMKCLFTNIQKQ